MNEYDIVEITLEDLPKCSSFWGYPNNKNSISIIELKMKKSRCNNCKIGVEALFILILP